MKKIGFLILSLVFLTSSYSQITTKGHTNENKFKQMYDLLATPNEQHNASGAPGKGYTQQKVDYKIDITLDDEKQKISGEETIKYHNNSPDNLEFLWVQLDQNMRAQNSKTPLVSNQRIAPALTPEKLRRNSWRVVLMEVLILNI